MTRRQFAAFFSVAANARLLRAAEGDELIGKPAPPLALKDWLNSRPLEMTDLRGKVVLLRWWTEGCPFCAATAPALVSLAQEYGSRDELAVSSEAKTPGGLVVIGVFHPKPPGKWTMEAVRNAAAKKHFTFPIAVDGNWTALKRWWLMRDRGATSVSFVVDQSGIIRFVHPGGEFHEGNTGGTPTHEACNRDMHLIRGEIAKLLSV